MKKRLVHGLVLLTAVFILYGIVSFGSVASAQDNIDGLVPCEPSNPYNNEQCMKITLPCTDTEPDIYGKAGWYHHTCNEEEILIPNGRPIYAFLVSGFDQNHDFNMFHFYNFARHIFELTENLEKKAYVHFAWWNNLLAPYMEKPLHNVASVPSHGGGALNALPDYFGFLYDPVVLENVPTKAIPAEDYQFQEDARAVLMAIHENNPEAVIILVGHSMGGDSVIRLADQMLPHDFPIALLAPIDPVGNRTCLPESPLLIGLPALMGWYNTVCWGAYNFTRFQATHWDIFFDPPRISFENKNIGYLYHRWQTEFMFPFDYGCPDKPGLCPLQDHMIEEPLPDRYLFRHHEPRSANIGQDNTNVQSMVQTSLKSGTEVYPNWWYWYNSGGWIDGHGEIVGFRAIKPLTMYSWPLALEAQGKWPSKGDRDDERIAYMKAWEKDPEYFEKNGYAPKNPDLCKVSGDLSDILDYIMGQAPEVNQPPVADANGPYQSECEGTSITVSLDGSGSSDPEGSNLDYFWYTDCPSVSPENPTSNFDDPTSATPVLTVDTSNGCAVDCIVELTVIDNLGKESYAKADVSIGDTVSPRISCPADTTVECDESTNPNDTGLATVTDECDLNPAVAFSDVAIHGDCQQEATIERTWSATDYCGNTSSCVQTIEVVDTTPPVISSVSANPEILWPPNHQMRPIAVEAVAIDNCDPEPACKIISVTSNEPIDGKGDGNTTPDWEITGDLNVKLRAERAGGGIGRQYTITVKCIDDCNNSAFVDSTVTVPHDKGKKDK
jgi:hypothetical protein